MCNCRSEIEAKLLESVKGQLPGDIKDLTVELGGYAFMLGAELQMKNIMPINVEYQAPVKKAPGTFKPKKQTMNMTGSYCMFCGEKYAKTESGT